MQNVQGAIQYKYDFLKYSRMCFIASMLLIASGITAYFVKGGFNYHIDFVGGAEIRVSFENPIDVASLRDAMKSSGWDNSVIQNVGSTGCEYIVRIGMIEENLENKIKKSLSSHFVKNKITINNVDWVGAEVGKDTKWDAIKAVFLSLIILMLYIAIRSEFSFGIGAVAALAHDILTVLVFVLFAELSISLNVLAAVLAVLGYSLNDTIIIFSRIRENMKKFSGESDYDIVNLSINQMLTRTILTSFTTFLSLLAIVLLGGEGLRGLSLVMTCGVITGTYSSVYMASSIMLIAKPRFSSSSK
jgi:preprotein translocase subunit SecF